MIKQEKRKLRFYQHFFCLRDNEADRAISISATDNTNVGNIRTKFASRFFVIFKSAKTFDKRLASTYVAR